MSFAQPFGDYEILDRVGAGAMGTVFKARQRKLGRIVALKVLRPSLARDERYVDRLKREARIVAALNHPHIVTGYDLGEENGYHFFVMEFVEGKSLRALLAEWGIFSEDRVLDVAVQVASALDHAYERGVIHRDVKPGNILIDEHGAVKLTDMGLAKGPADLALTRDGATVGTPQYISPEQARNPQDVDVRSDLYSLGATLYHMATGQPPFRGESMAEVITKVLHEAPTSPRLLNPQLSEGMSLVIRKLMAKNLRIRYQTPRELLDDLERLRRDLPPQVDERRLSEGETSQPANVWLWSLLTVAAASVVLLAVWIGMQLRSEREATATPNEYVAALRAELDELETFGGRIARLRVAAAEGRSGTAQDIELLLRRVTAELQGEVDRLAQELGAQQWAAIEAWLLDPGRWPSVADFEQERVARPLLARTGLLREQLPANVQDRGLEHVVAEVQRVVRARDQGLLSRFRHHVEVALPARADQRLRAGDFTGTERIWRDGFATFFDGRRHPLPELVDDASRARFELVFERARQAGLEQVDAAEANLANAMTHEAGDGAAAVREGIAQQRDPELLRAAARQLREELVRAYPASTRFRPGNDPWPAVEAALDGLDQDVALYVRGAARRRADTAIDLAWRALCSGDATAALGVLGDPARDLEELAGLLEGHRRALRAAGLVSRAVIRGLQRAEPPVPGYPRNGAAAMELRVLGDQPPRLVAQPPGGSPRPAQLTEFRFADLYQRAHAAAPDLLAALPPEERELGRLVLGLIGDELADTTERLADVEGGFLRDEVWPRIVRVRGDRGQEGIDRALAYRRVHDAWTRARQGGDPGELEATLAGWHNRFQDDASADERAAVAAAARWLERERSRRRELRELEASVPEGAVVRLEDDGEQRRAEVELDGPALQRGAADYWQLRGGLLEFAGGPQVFADVGARRLDIEAGLRAASTRADVELQLVLPPADHGQRIYVLQFRGVGVVLVASDDDRIYGAVVEGDPRRVDLVRAAVRRALGGALVIEDAPRLLPGAVHRLTVAVDTNPSRTRAAVAVRFEDDELCRDRLAVDPEQPPTVVLWPLQDVGVVAATLHAEMRL